jgi:hypothetical protein
MKVANDMLRVAESAASVFLGESSFTLFFVCLSLQGALYPFMSFSGLLFKLCRNFQHCSKSAYSTESTLRSGTCILDTCWLIYFW